MNKFGLFIKSSAEKGLWLGACVGRRLLVTHKGRFFGRMEGHTRADSWVYEGVDVETCTAETNLDDVIENCESNSTQYDEIEVYCHEKIEILKSDFNTNNCFSFDFANFHSCVLDLCSQIDAGVEVFQERKGKIVCSTLQAIDS